MKCSEFTNVIDSYLDGTLAEDKMEALEMHYFECDDCFARLKVAERLHSNEIHIVAAVDVRDAKPWAATRLVSSGEALRATIGSPRSRAKRKMSR